MKYLRFVWAVLVLFCLTKPALAACTGSSPNLTAPTWADVQACHTAATNGDTITVTAGSYTVTATTTITKHVTIIAGGVVTLTDNVADVADLINITESTVGHTRIQGFTFVQGSGQHLNPNGVINMVYASSGLGILITGNSYASGTTGDFIVAGVNRGVIWNNSITATWLDVPGVRCSNNVAFVRHKNLGLTSVWTEGPYYGADDSLGDKNLYIEENTLDNAFEGVDVDANARTVVRYNTIINSGILNHGVDTGDISGRYMDIYQNTFQWSTTPHCAGGAPASVSSVIYLRGAPALIHDNIIPNVTGAFWGDKSEITFTDEKLRRSDGTYGCWTGGYPSRQQVGWGYSTGGTMAGTTGEYQDLEPVYLWSNTGAGNYGAPAVVDYPVNQCGGGAPSSSTYIMVNREYYLGTAKPGYSDFTFPHPYRSTNFYVAKLCASGVAAPNCSNLNNGTSRETAKLTMAAGIALMSSGDTLIMGDGTYNESINDNLPSGSSGNPTTIRSENANGAILSPTSPASGIVVYINGNDWMTFDGLDLNCGSSSGDCQVIYINGTSAGHFIFQNGTIRGGKGNLGSGIEFEDLVSDNSVINNDVRGNGTGGTGGFAHGMYISSANNLIERNHVHDNVGYGIHIYTPSVGASNNIVRYNTIEANGFGGFRGGMLVGSGSGNLTHNNVFSMNYVGLEVYSGCTGCLNYFNTIYGNTGAGIHIFSGVSSSNVRNNIVFGNGSAIVDEGSGTTASNNLTTDPLFVQAAIGDFHLKPTSAALPPCGVAITGLTQDFDDITRPNPPSCGAFEVPSGVDPDDPLSEDFESYSASASIGGLNGGAGWTQSWTLDTGVVTVETAPAGMTGKALRINSTSDAQAHRFFTAHTGDFVISVKMRLSITNPDSFGIGFALLDPAGGFQSSVYFHSTGIKTENQVLLFPFADNTNYTIEQHFDTAGHPNQLQTRINGGTYSSWENCVTTCAAISGIVINSYSTNVHTFWVDDISDTVGGGAGTITGVTPASGVRCISGQACQISWASNGITGNVNIYYLVGGNQYLIASPAYDATPYAWTVNAPASTSSQIRVSQGAVTDDSDIFTIFGTKSYFK